MKIGKCFFTFEYEKQIDLGPVLQRHGRTAILRPSYDATFIFSRLSYDCFTKLVIKGSQIYDLS